MIVTFGETMLRLSPPGYQRFTQAGTFQAFYGGAESNCAVSLCCLGEPARHVTVLPDNDLGRACKGELARYGVDVSKITMDSGETGRIGIYFCENGASQRSSAVIYDRKNSSFSLARREDFDWNDLLQNAQGFHFTGITPALSPELAMAAMDGCKAAKRLGIPVSLDLNYRAKLWSRAQARETLTEYLPYVDLLFANNGSLHDVLGIAPGDYGREATLAAARETGKHFPIPEIALTMRTPHSASRNTWSAMTYRPETGESWFSRDYEMEIVDRIGAGDSFAAGLLFARRQEMDPQAAVEFAAAAACLKHTIPGDVNPATRREVENLAFGPGNGMIQR